MFKAFPERIVIINYDFRHIFLSYLKFNQKNDYKHFIYPLTLRKTTFTQK